MAWFTHVDHLTHTTEVEMHAPMIVQYYTG